MKYPRFRRRRPIYEEDIGRVMNGMMFAYGMPFSHHALIGATGELLRRTLRQYASHTLHAQVSRHAAYHRGAADTARELLIDAFYAYQAFLEDTTDEHEEKTA